MAPFELNVSLKQRKGQEEFPYGTELKCQDTCMGKDIEKLELR